MEWNTSLVMKNNIIKKIVLFAGICGLPAFFILVLNLGKPHFERLPYLGEHEVSKNIIDGVEVVDTIFYKVDGFSFEDENGNQVTEKDFEDKILLVNFISANCPHDSMNVCPMNFQMFKRLIYDEFLDNKGFKDVRIISHFLSDGDTAADMKLTYQHYNINPEVWRFVKSQENSIFDAPLGLGNSWEKPDTVYYNEREAYVMTLLLDRDRHVRGKYLTTMTDQIHRMTKEISLLLREEKEADAKK